MSETSSTKSHAPPSLYHRLADFADYFQTGVPILAYHSIEPTPAGTDFHALFCPREHFAVQMNEFAQAGFSTIQPIQSLQEPGAKKMVLTFDDGYQSLIPNALPELVRHGFASIVYLVADCIGKTNTWSQSQPVNMVPLMGFSEVREWLAAGQRIGSHTLTHPRLAQIDPLRAREEITVSRKRLEDLFGVAIEDFCYPYGDWNPAVRDLVMEAGYKTAVTINYGLNRPGIHPGGLKRLIVKRPLQS